EFESVWHAGQVRASLFGKVRGMIVQDDANAKSRRIVLVCQLKKLDEFCAPVAISNQPQHLPAEQLNAGQQRYCAVPLVLMIASDPRVPTRYRRQIQIGRAS